MSKSATARRLAVLAAAVIASCHEHDGQPPPKAHLSGPEVEASESFDVNQIDEKGISRLLDAVNASDEVRARALLSAGAAADLEGVARSPLVSAIMAIRGGAFKCDLDMVKLLLEFGANPNRADLTVETRPLNRALEIGDIECARLLMSHGASIDGLDPGGRTLLDSAVAGAVHSGDLQIIDLAVQWGIDVNVRARKGSTALVTAAWLDSPPAIRRLLDLGADPCIADHEGRQRTPLHMAKVYAVSRATIELLESAGTCARVSAD